MSSVPSYTDSSYSLTTSPPYSSSAADDLPDHYIFKSHRIKLDLGPRMWSTSSPCYGHTGIVAGIVHLSDLNHIKQVNVTLEATVKIGFNERGTQTCCAEKVLFRRTTTLSPTPASAETPTTHYMFSFTLPANQDNSTEALPPSVVQFSASNSAEIRYRICVDAIRSGLRRRESLIVPILYLPRSYTPLMARPVPFGNKIGLLPEDSLKELHLVPKFLTKSISKDKLSSKTDVGAKIALPSLLVVASGDKIPFVLTIYSEAPALAALYTNVILQLIKIVKIKAHEKSSTKETVISSAEVYDVDQCSNGTQILRGQLGSGSPGAESSWSVADLIETRYILRLSIKTPSSASALVSNLPVFEGFIVMQVKSDRHDPNADMARPLLCLVNADNG